MRYQFKANEKDFVTCVRRLHALRTHVTKLLELLNTAEKNGSSSENIDLTPLLMEQEVGVQALTNSVLSLRERIANDKLPLLGTMFAALPISLFTAISVLFYQQCLAYEIERLFLDDDPENRKRTYTIDLEEGVVTVHEARPSE